MAELTCAACGTPNPAGARFCNGCGAPLEPVTSVSESRRTVTIVFVDVAGSTALGERLDPETMRALIGQFFDVARDVVERHGGFVEKFIGDAVMAVFGLPVLHEDDALRAVRAAAELRDRHVASALADRLAIRTGVNTGEVVAGDPTTGQRLVTGDAVNTAARLEQAAQPGQILLGPATHRLVRDAVVATEVAPIEAKGKAAPLRAFRLEQVNASAEATIRHLDAPLVGRQRELARLLRSYEDVVAERRCGLFTLLGPAGVGKSRLVYELVARLRGEATVLRGRSLPYGEGITYWPIGEMVRSAARIDEADDHAAASDKLRALVAGTPEADEILDRVAKAIGIATGESPRDDLFRAVRRLFEILAADRPVVAVFDDLHWAEPTLVDLVEHIADWSRGSPILLVVLARPEFLDTRPAWGGGKLDAQTVLLEGLGEDLTRELARSILGGADVDERLLDRIEAVAEGNPLFVEQLVAMLVEDGRLVRDGGAWRSTAELLTLDVPPTISALLAARLDGLPSAERAVAARASVVGRVFERLAVTQLSPEPERNDISVQLRSLVRRELIRPDPASTASDETFRFRHILIRDAAYDALPKRDRADLHARFADWLEGSMAGRLAEFEEIVGYHLDQAIQYRDDLGIDDVTTQQLRVRAFRHLAEAGLRAADRSDGNASIRLLTRAADIARPVDLDSMEVLLTLGFQALTLGRLDEAIGALDEARGQAIRRGDPAREARAELLSVITRMQRDPTILGDELEAVAARCEAVLERADYGPGLVDLWMVRAMAALTRARWAVATEAYERALGHAEAIGAAGLSDEINLFVASALVWGPEPVPAGTARCEELMDRAHSRSAKAILRATRAVLLAYASRAAEARDLMADARATLADLGVEGPTIGSELLPAEIEIADGDFVRAVELLQAGRVLLGERGETGVRSTVEGFLSMTLARLGRAAEALEASIASEGHAAADDMASQMSWRAGRAHALALEGRFDEALELAAAATTYAERTDQPNATAEVWSSRAAVASLAGQSADAREAYDRAIALFEAKGNLPAAARIRAERGRFG